MNYHIQHQLKKLNLGLLVLWLSLFSLGQLQRIELGQGIAVYALDILTAGWTLLLIWSGRSDLRFALSISNLKQWRWELLWLGWMVTGLLVNAWFGQSPLLPLMYIGRLSLYLVFGYALKKSFSLSSSFIAPIQLRWALILVGILIGAWGLLQYALMPDTRWLSILGWDDHYYRLISTLLDPAFTGLLLVMTFVWLQQSVTPRYQLWQKLLSMLLIGAITLTFSRSSYLALGSGILLLTLIKSSHRQLGFIYGVVLLLCIAIAPKPAGEGVNLARTASITRRQNNAVTIVSSLQPYQWIIGRGLFAPYRPVVNQQNNVDISQHARIPDNVLIFFVSGMGMVGFVLTGIVGIKWLRWLYHRDRLLWISGVTLLIHSLFNASLVQPQIVLFFVGGMASLPTKPTKS